FVFPTRLDPGKVEFPPSQTPAMNRALAGDFGFMRAVDRRGREILAAYRPVGYGGWGLSAQMDVQEAYAPVNRLRGLLLAIGRLIGCVVPDRATEHQADPSPGRYRRHDRQGQPRRSHRHHLQ